MKFIVYLLFAVITSSALASIVGMEINLASVIIFGIIAGVLYKPLRKYLD